MMALGNMLRGLWGAALLICLLTACVPAAPGGATLVSPGPAAGIEASRDAPPPAKGARPFSQAEVETLAGVVAGPCGVTGEVLTGGRLWDENQSLHFGAGSAQVSPAKCSGVLA